MNRLNQKNRLHQIWYWFYRVACSVFTQSNNNIRKKIFQLRLLWWWWFRNFGWHSNGIILPHKLTLNVIETFILTLFIWCGCVLRFDFNTCYCVYPLSIYQKWDSIFTWTKQKSNKRWFQWNFKILWIIVYRIR